uniref:Uncharacterized protein n=1 Tax=Knipowitschia caucasica TaxID=637954 RepID=A0AAV2MG54_KNICA
MQVKDSAFLWRPLFLSVEAPASRLGDTQSPVPNPQGQEAVPRREGSAGEQGADEMEIGRDTPTPTPLTNHPHPKETSPEPEPSSDLTPPQIRLELTMCSTFQLHPKASGMDYSYFCIRACSAETRLHVTRHVSHIYNTRRAETEMKS